MSAYREITAYACKCERCGHEWRAVEMPDRCAKCKRLHWNVKRGTLPRGRPPGGKGKPRKAKR